MNNIYKSGLSLKDMKKRVFVLIVFGLIIGILSVSLISAGLFGDFWSKITGRAVQMPDSCVEFNDTLMSAWHSSCRESNYDARVDIVGENFAETPDCYINVWDSMTFSDNAYNESWCSKRLNLVEPCHQTLNILASLWHSKCGDSNYDAMVDFVGENFVVGADCYIDVWDLMFFSDNYWGDEAKCSENLNIKTCIDSDGGEDYYIKGTASKEGWEDIEDFCINDIKLSEALCNNENNPAYAQYDCPNGCSDGACIKEDLTCSDRTNYSFCSITKPLYCDKGNLINNCSFCGCPSEEECKTDGSCGTKTSTFSASCIEFNNTLINTWHVSCGGSNYDSRVDLVGENFAEGSNCYIDIWDLMVFADHWYNETWCTEKLNISEPEELTCSDGTNYGKCSTTKPKYCANGNLIDKCSVCGCLEGYKCKIDESCEFIQIPKENKKDMSKYSDKEVFLISDKNWKDVLSLVPLTTWTGNENCKKGYGTPDNVCVYPILIYHEENFGFDADSIIYFMQQYNTQKVTIIGETPQELDNLLITQPELGAGLPENQIQKINVENYLAYWQEFKDMVYVEDNYELALLASTYASLINVPLIIQGTSLDQNNLFSNRNIICVGNVNKNCNEKYNLEQLQQKYVDEINTDKIILVNPDDLNIKVDEEFQPEKSGNPVNELYSKTSLSAPILASAKHEIILSTTSTNYLEVDDFIESSISDLGINPEYLTIIASPNAIEMSYKTLWMGYPYGSTDAWQYSNIDDDVFLDLAVGRIFGITISDASSNIVRSLFYEEILKNEDKILVTRGSPNMISAAKIYALGEFLTTIGYQTKATPAGTIAEDWKNKFLIDYHDHGSPYWAGISSSQIPYLDNSFVVLHQPCSTCAFRKPTSKKLLFCANIIRKGGVGLTTATDFAYYNDNEGFLAELFAQESTVGKAFIDFKNSEMSFNVENLEANYLYWLTLLGDPTLKLKTIHTIPKPQADLISGNEDKKSYKLIISAMKIEVPEDVDNLCERPVNVPNLSHTLYISNTCSGVSSIDPRFTSRIKIPNNFDPVATSYKWHFHKETENGEKYLRITSPRTLSLAPPWIRHFSSANDYEFTNFEFNPVFYSKAPDLIIENPEVDVENQELTFYVKNIGNGEANVVLNISNSLQGCSTELSYYYLYHFSKVLRDYELSISPSESEMISISLPEQGNLLGKLSDHSTFSISINLYPPNTFVEQNYYNKYDKRC